ncbi:MULTISPECIES: TetR/AcrR family transcriptional regulator C-terminal domain-containing protein [Deferrisoma]
MGAAQERRAERERQILEAAIRAFSRHGYHQCTVAQVAREAGVADGTIYIYFKGKDDLLVCAFRHVLETILEELDRDLTDITDPLERIRFLVERHLEVMERDPELAAFLQLQLRQPDASIRQAIAEPLRAYARKIEQVVDEAKAAGAVRTDLATHVIRRVLFGAVDETVSAWVLNPRRGPLKPKAQAICDIVFHGIRAPRSGQ